MFALNETQQCKNWRYTPPHPYFLLDQANQKRCEWNNCQTSSCSFSQYPNNTTNDNENDHSLSWPPIQWNTTGTVTQVGKVIIADMLKSHSKWTIFDRKIAVRVTNTTELPYWIKKKKQIAKFSVVAQKQSKIIKLVDTAILSLISEGNPDLTRYLNEFFSASKVE